MFLAGFPSAVFATNCFVIAPAAGEECVVVDPGIEVLDWLAETLREQRLRPAAVMLTHGHIDHTYTVTPVCSTHAAPAVIHDADAYRLDDPLNTVDRSLVAMLEQQFGSKATWARPDDVRTFADGDTVRYAGLDFGMIHAPGHTEGSTMFSIKDVPDAIASAPANGGVVPSSTVISGDVLFAGSIGRTDLPGGDHQAMLRSLRDKVLPLPDDTLILPGHGPGTLMGRERATNPYLLELQ